MSTSQDQLLFTPIRVGRLELKNRMVMSPMTRGRVTNTELAPGRLQAIYYEQRVSAGLIITEGTWVNRQAIGYNNVPGIFSEEQIKGWELVTNAVHAKGGKIFLQLGHTGALSHPDFLGGDKPVAPSAVNPNMTAYTANGAQDTVTPEALTTAAIKQTLSDYKKAAQNAKEAGFDGIEIHAQHPSLAAQFLSDHLNRRTDEYGGSIENKTRFLFEVLDTLNEVWGKQRVSIKINPYLRYGTPGLKEKNLATYTYLAERLNNYDLAFLHIINHPDPSTPPDELDSRDLFGHFRSLYNGLIMANGGFDKEKANRILAHGAADLVSFATLFIANPDLPERFRRDLPLNEGDPSTYIFGDERGYTDYAFIEPIATEQA